MSMPEHKRILLISGSTRDGSTNTAALRAVAAAAPDWVTAGLYGGLSDLPAFNPDHDGPDLPPAPAGLRREIAAADAVMFCTPEYAGTLPGSFKNLLDWTVGGGELDGKPVAWLNVANQGRGGGAQATLETVLGYVGATVVEPACRRLPVARDWVSAAGVITDPGFRAEVADAVAALAGGAPE
jgi:chromate reductase, NAD(P)H dehydrogenase (quinone)